jgi:DNA-binding transcriptional LysR family regulator
VAPPAGAKIIGRVDLRWAANPEARFYWLQVARDRAFSDRVVDRRDLVETTLQLEGLAPGIYHWRVTSLRQADDAGPLGGTVVVGALVSALMGAFADGLWALKRRHPQLDVRLLAGLSADFARGVDRGELDAAVVTQPPAPLAADLVWAELYAEPMVLIVPRRPHFTLPEGALEILSETPFIRFDRQAWTGHLVDAALAQCGATVREGMELNSVEAILALVRQGFGVSIVPQLANLQWTRDQLLRIVPLPGVDVQRHVGLLERRHHARERFTAEIKAYFASGAARRGRSGAAPDSSRQV